MKLRIFIGSISRQIFQVRLAAAEQIFNEGKHPYTEIDFKREVLKIYLYREI